MRVVKCVVLVWSTVSYSSGCIVRQRIHTSLLFSCTTEQISNVYGRQSVVISVDPKRVYVASKAETSHEVLEVTVGGETKLCWWQCTVKGGREVRDLSALLLLLLSLRPACGLAVQDDGALRGS